MGFSSVAQRSFPSLSSLIKSIEYKGVLKLELMLPRELECYYCLTLAILFRRWLAFAKAGRHQEHYYEES